jgi:small multidrug resistance pump
MTAWLYLAAAISSEVGSTVALRYTDGFTAPLPTALSLAGYALSIWLLALTLKGLDISLVYAVWAGIGTAAIALIGMTALGEQVTPLKLISIAVIIAGVVGLNLQGAG